MSYYNDDRYQGGYGERRDGYNDEYETTTTTTTTTYDNNDDGYRRGGYGGGGPPPPPEGVPRPWYAQWDERAQRYVFINDQSGERRWEFPQGGGYGYDDEYSRTTTTTTQYRDDDYQQQQQRGGGGHGMLYGALGAAAGLAGGALLVNGAEDVRDDYDRDKYRVEQGFEDAPENVAGWIGNKVGEVEDIPGDIAHGVGDVVDDVVDAPENVAHWVGDKVGDVERFGDNVDYAYDEGRQQGRDDGW